MTTSTQRWVRTRQRVGGKAFVSQFKWVWVRAEDIFPPDVLEQCWQTISKYPEQTFIGEDPNE